MTLPRDGDGPPTDAPMVLFVCAHGAAKSVLAAAEFDRLARAAGLAIDVQAAGIEPDPTVSPAVIDDLPEQTRLELPKPRRLPCGTLWRDELTVTYRLRTGTTDGPGPR